MELTFLWFYSGSGNHLSVASQWVWNSPLCDVTVGLEHTSLWRHSGFGTHLSVMSQWVWNSPFCNITVGLEVLESPFPALLPKIWNQRRILWVRHHEQRIFYVGIHSCLLVWPVEAHNSEPELVTDVPVCGHKMQVNTKQPTEHGPLLPVPFKTWVHPGKHNKTTLVPCPRPMFLWKLLDGVLWNVSVCRWKSILVRLVSELHYK